MANAYFKFKKFTVWHDKCAMKVGTDGVLLGAWVDITASQNILDVGTGSGLVALMIAQRTADNSSAKITAIDIDSAAIEQATSNCISSPWSEKLSVCQADFNTFSSDMKFDTIVSNPPYFNNALLSPDAQRSAARHTDSLSYETLIERAVQLLTPDGKFTLIIPYDTHLEVKKIARKHHLFASKELLVRTKPEGDIKRIIISFGFKQEETISEELVVELARHHYSKEYTNLTRDFYLKM